MTNRWILVKLICLLLIKSAYLLPQGAPTSVCISMLPKHGGGIEPQTDASPYIISVPAQRLPAATPIQVTLTSPQGFHIQGYMLQARRANTGQPIGKFSQVDATIGQPLHCGADNQPDTITHVNPTSKSAVVANWEAPDDYQGLIIFNSTVAQSYSTFWVGVESSPIQIVKRSPDDIGISTTRRPLSPTTTPQYTYSPDPTSPASATGQDPFYDDCGRQKSCLGAPAGCEATRNCKAVVSVTVRGERYIFELKSLDPQAAYVAVGLSDDNKMGDDSTIECVRDGNRPQAYMGYTTPRPNLNAFRLPNSQENIRLIRSNTEDGSLYCQVERNARTSVQGKTYDLINDKFYLLIASGAQVEANKVRYHTLAYLASAESKSLADVSGFTAASKLLLRLHGAFMVIAWIGTASLGILLARYFRQTWVDRQLCGKDQWFAWHRFLMALTWLLTMAGFIIIFVELQSWSSERNPHAILGTVTTVICFLQPIGAFFRPHPGTPKRPYFNWIHWFGGNVAHILAIVTIFFAVKLNKAELPKWMDFILVAFVAFHVVMHLILSILGCVSDKPNGHRVSSFPMKDMGSGVNQGRNSVISERKMDAPYSCLRKVLLGIYIIGVAVIVTALAVIVVLAPIDDMIQSLKRNLNMT